MATPVERSIGAAPLDATATVETLPVAGAQADAVKHGSDDAIASAAQDARCEVPSPARGRVVDPRPHLAAVPAE